MCPVWKKINKWLKFLNSYTSIIPIWDIICVLSTQTDISLAVCSWQVAFFKLIRFQVGCWPEFMCDFPQSSILLIIFGHSLGYGGSILVFAWNTHQKSNEWHLLIKSAQNPLPYLLAYVLKTVSAELASLVHCLVKVFYY